MIFITVGSQKFQFDRLLKAVDELVEKEEIQEEVFAQRGASTYTPVHYVSKEFLNRDEFKEIMNKSDIVITHGGTGAIVGALKAGKKVIAVPRLKKYREHVDDHQLQLIEEFEKNNLISRCDDLNNLKNVINDLNEKEFNMYQSNTSRYLENIKKYIEDQ